MAIVYTSSKIAFFGLMSLFSLVLSSANFVKAEPVKSGQTKLSNRQLNLVKCGYRQKDISLKLPSDLSSSQTSKLEVNRVERDNNIRCNDYQPPIGLTALIPSSNIGITLSEHPTFFFYVPDVNLEGVEGEFVLRNEQDEQIYAKKVTLKSSDSIVSVELFDVPLEVGKSYYWVFSLLLDKVDRSSNTDVAGWIKRIEPNSAIKKQLSTASHNAQPEIYASNGIWYEALTTLAKLRCTSPNDSSIASSWTSLLQQVELTEIAKKPLAECH